MRRSPTPSRMPLPPLVFGLALLLLLSLVGGTGLGAAGIGWPDVLRFLWAGLTGGTVHAGDAASYTIVWEIRLPRVVLGAVVGAGLASVGVAVQAIVRNALGDPFVLGISSGAAVGANAVILLGAFAGLGVWALSASAFLSALGAMALVYAVARSPHGLTPLRLVLTGTALAYGFEAVTTVMVFGAARGEAARSALMWLLGSLGGATWAQVPLVAVTVAAGWAWLRQAGPNRSTPSPWATRPRPHSVSGRSGCAGSCSSSPPPSPGPWSRSAGPSASSG